MQRVNSPPVADAGGPYMMNQGSGLTLDASASYDPDMVNGDSIIMHDWDLANHGTFGISSVLPAMPLPAAVIEAFGFAPGTHTIHLRVTDSHGATDTASTTLTIRGTQTITFDPIAAPYGDAPFTIGARASSGLPVTFTSLMPSVATVSGSTVTIVGAGTATIRASQTGDANWQPAPDVDQTFTVAKAMPVITWALATSITSSTPLSAAQLNATANVPGTFCCDPASGTTLPRGTHVLSAHFAPNDPANYTTASATVSLEVLNSAPVDRDRTVHVYEDSGGGQVQPLQDADGDAVAYFVVTAPQHGRVELQGGYLIYQPDANYNGPDVFTFKGTDGVLESREYTYTVLVLPVNDPPAATGQSLQTNDNQPLPITLAGSDAETAILTYRIVSGPAAGTLSGMPPEVICVPAFPYAGSDAFTFEVEDADGATASATVAITILASDRPPVAVAGPDQTVVAGTDCRAAVTVDGSASSDPDGDALSFAWELRQYGQMVGAVNGQAIAS